MHDVHPEETRARVKYLIEMLASKNPAPKIEESKTSKADLIAALNQAVAYCDKAYDGLTDTSSAQTVKFRGMDTPKLTILNVNNGHASEHYGNLVTYMRLKGLVPPSSAPKPTATGAKK